MVEILCFPVCSILIGISFLLYPTRNGECLDEVEVITEELDADVILENVADATVNDMVAVEVLVVCCKLLLRVTTPELGMP